MRVHYCFPRATLLLILTTALTAPGNEGDQQGIPTNSIRIAVVQQNANPGKPEENRQKALRFASEALEGGADVVLFHEELIVGYVKDPREFAEPVDGATTQAFRSLLAGRQSLIIYGLTERAGEKYFISATVVSADGVLTNYHKTHLWWKAQGPRHEPTYYSAGDRLVTFDFKGCPCGLMICYDGDFPEMTRAYANRGCWVLFWMNNRGSRGYTEVRELAARNSMVMATSCCCGIDESGNVCRGGSNITDATGKLLAEIWDREGIIITNVVPARVPSLRAQNPAYRGQRPELYR
jgi:predicted amidohydrolase